MKTGYRLRLGRMKLGKAICKEFLTVGIPSAVQSVVITLWNRLHHLVLPMTIVVLEHLWYYAYMIRNKLLEKTRADYVLLGKSKGLSKRIRGGLKMYGRKVLSHIG